jgi:branched-subunit amino acid transport protein
MSPLWTVVGMAAGVYALRLCGLALPDRALSPSLRRAMTFLPIALLSGAVVSGLAVSGGDGAARLVALIGAALIALRARRMWACILGGMLIYWFSLLI